MKPSTNSCILFVVILPLLLTGCQSSETNIAQQYDPSRNEYHRDCYLASHAADKGNLVEAIQLYKKCIETGNLSKPNLAKAHHSLGITYYELGEYQNAVDAFTKSISLDFHDKQSDYTDRGSSWSNLKQYDKAMKDFRKSHELNPNDPKLYYNRGILYERMGDLTKAKNDFSKAYKLGLRAPQLTDRLIKHDLIEAPPHNALGRPAPDGYKWVFAEEINVLFACPEDWHVKGHKSSTQIDYFLSKENLYKVPTFTTGLNFSVMRFSTKDSTASDFAKSMVKNVSSEGKVIDEPWNRNMGNLNHFGTTMEKVDNRRGRYIAYFGVIANDKTGSIYIYQLEAPIQDAQEISAIYKTMFSELIIDESF